MQGIYQRDLRKFLEEVVKMGFLVVDGVAVHVLIGLTDLKRLQATLDLGGQFVDFNTNKRSVRN